MLQLLYVIDTHTWHTPERADSGLYPITRVNPDEMMIGRTLKNRGIVCTSRC